MYGGFIYQGLSGLRGEQGPPGPVGPPGNAGIPVSRNTNFYFCICPPVSSIQSVFEHIYSSLVDLFQGKAGEDGKPGSPGKVVTPHCNLS